MYLYKSLFSINKLNQNLVPFECSRCRAGLGTCVWFMRRFAEVWVCFIYKGGLCSLKWVFWVFKPTFLIGYAIWCLTSSAVSNTKPYSGGFDLEIDILVYSKFSGYNIISSRFHTKWSASGRSSADSKVSKTCSWCRCYRSKLNSRKNCFNLVWFSISFVF